MIEVVNEPRRRDRKYYSHGKERTPHKDRRFVAWDGESSSGLGPNGENTSDYVLFGNSDGWEISSNRLRTTDCLSFIIDHGCANTDVIHIGFAFNFDVNHLLRDLPKSRIEELKRTNEVWWEQYRINYYPKKWFTIWDNIRKVQVKIYDIFTYFMTSAVKAWNEYLGDDPRVTTVSKGKDQRDKFIFEDLESVIRPYFRVELELYVDLIEKLRGLLHTAGIIPNGWYGPGSIANALLSTRTKHLIQRDIPSEVIEAAQFAYFGGRFEQFKTGAYKGPIFSYDVRSAYPHALRLLPNLGSGEWMHTMGTPEQFVDFALYKVDFDYDKSGAPYHGRMHVPMPFPYRDSRSQIHYPARVRGWYWGCEVSAAAQWFTFRVTESWTFQENDGDKPFHFLAEMYATRNRWKNQGNKAQLALKLGLNSIYGKLAQRVGWNEKTGAPPKWHQLEYSGFATAYCRSMVFSAIMQNPMSIVAVETDGLFSTEPLTLPLGKELGEWEEELYDGIVYVQSGVYWLSKWKAHIGLRWHKARTRGFGSKDLGISRALECVPTLSPIRGTSHRFAGFNGYLYREQWLTWIDSDHVAVWGGNGKRAHMSGLCGKCQGRDAQLHDLVIVKPWGGNSSPHFLPWKPDTGIANEYAEDEERIKWVLENAREL